MEKRLKKILLAFEKWTLRIIIFAIAAFFLVVYLYNRHQAKVLFLAEAAPPSLNHQAALMAKVKQKPYVSILTVDGGGMRGLIALQILSYLEQKTGKPISQLFDVLGGTSTGAIIVTGLTIAGKGGQPRYSAQQLSNVYEALGERLLATSIIHKVLTAGGLFGPVYDIKGVDRALENFIGKDTQFNDSLALVIIYTYSLSDLELKALKSWDIGAYHHNFYQHSLVLSAIAAPGFFLPVALLLNKEAPLTVNIDSALFLDNPALQTMREVSNAFPNKKYIIFSIGLGMLPLGIVSSKNRFGFHGLLYWATMGSKVSMRSQVQKENNYLRDLEKQKNGPVKYYLRINPSAHTLTQCDLFSADSFCINAFKRVGQEAVQQNKKQLDQLAALLMANT